MINDAFMSSRTRAFKRDGISRTQRSGGEDNDPPHRRTSPTTFVRPCKGVTRLCVTEHAQVCRTSETDSFTRLENLAYVVQCEHTCMADFRNIV